MNAGGIPYTRTSAILRALRGLLFFILLISFSLPTPASADEWEPVAEGIDYRVFREPGPNVVHVARMTRGRPELTIETSLANRELADGKQTVSGMAELYDGTLSSWEPTWGSRMDVKVAINGSFHDVEDGSPHSGSNLAGTSSASTTWRAAAASSGGSTAAPSSALASTTHQRSRD